MMYHPMHLHGHTIQVPAAGGGGQGARNDTVIVRPHERIVADLAADNPRQWMTPATTPTTWKAAWPPPCPTANSPSRDRQAFRITGRAFG